MTTKKKKKELVTYQSAAKPQVQVPLYQASIRDICLDRELYIVDDPYQRHDVWELFRQQRLINCILQGLPIPPLEGYRRVNPVTQRIEWHFRDGHQRIVTVQKFHDGLFSTFSNKQKQHVEPMSEPPVEPCSTYQELSPSAQDFFVQYRFYVNEVDLSDNGNVNANAHRFNVLQSGVETKRSERLASYISEANTTALRLSSHRLYAEHYNGTERNKQTQQMSLYLIMIALCPGILVEIQNNASLFALAAGTRDKQITPEFITQMEENLDIMCHLLYGTVFNVQATVAAFYQAVLFIQKTYPTLDLLKKEYTGILTPWADRLIEQSSHFVGYRRPVQDMLRKAVQVRFWESELAGLLELFTK